MGSIAFTWEAGAGLGHVLPYLDLIRSLRSRGNNVIFVLKHPTRMAGVLEGEGVRILQAPVRTSPVTRPFFAPCTFAHILHNAGCDDEAALLATVRAWRDLFDEIAPDAVYFDHSPAALLAARPHGFEKIVCGTGFTLPPRVQRFPNLRRDVAADHHRLAADEAHVLERINRVLNAFHAAPLRVLSDLFACDRTLLRTVPELDPYRTVRENAEYVGLMSRRFGAAPDWPAGKRKKLFAYLKPFPLLPVLLSALTRSTASSLVYTEQLDQHIKARFTAPNLIFADGPLDLARVAGECDCAVLNGTHDTCLHMLQANVPMCNIPLNLEQALTAEYVQDMGAGLTASPTRSDQIISGLERLLASCRTASAPLSGG